MSVLELPKVCAGEKRKANCDVEQLPKSSADKSESSVESVLPEHNKRVKGDEDSECGCEDCSRRKSISTCKCEGCEKKEGCNISKFMGSWSLTTDEGKYSNLEGLTPEERDVYCNETEEESVQEIDLSANEVAAYPSSPEQSYEISSDDDISDEDIKMYGFQFSTFMRQQKMATQLYAEEKQKGEPNQFKVKWRGPKDSIWLNSMNMLRNMRSPSNKFRRHEIGDRKDTGDNKSLRAVYYRTFGMNSFGSMTQLYDVKRNLTLMKVVKGMTENHSICRLMHAMYETLPTVIEHNCDASHVDPAEAISSFAALLGYVNIKDSFMLTNPFTWQAPGCGEDCISKQRNPMPEPLLTALSNDLQYSRHEIPHDAGAWGILPLEVVRHNFWQIMYRLEGSDDCNDVVHSGHRQHGVLYNRDTIFRAQSIYKAMVVEHMHYKPNVPSASDCIESVLSNHDGGAVEVSSSLSRVHGREKMKKINRAFYPALHTCIQGLCMHYIAKGSLTEEDQIKIQEAVMQWYAEEWSIYRCNGCDVNAMGEKCFYDMTRELFSGESHLGAGGCATPHFI